MANFLVIGCAGTGKSTVGGILRKKGYAVIDTDFEPGLSGYTEKITGVKLRNPIYPINEEFIRKYTWVWDENVFENILRKTENRNLIFVGGSDNQEIFINKVDKAFCLYVDNKILLERLKKREPERWFEGSVELATNLYWNEILPSRCVEIGVSVVEGDRDPILVAANIDLLIQKYISEK